MPSALEQFQSALSVWVGEGCPNTEGRYYLLAAIRELQMSEEDDLTEVESQAVRTVLGRALKKSRYSRVGSCWELAAMLNEAAGWQDMTPDFLSSHNKAVERADQRAEVENHYVKYAEEARRRQKEEAENKRLEALEDEEEERRASLQALGEEGDEGAASGNGGFDEGDEAGSAHGGLSLEGVAARLNLAAATEAEELQESLASEADTSEAAPPDAAGSEAASSPSRGRQSRSGARSRESDASRARMSRSSVKAPTTSGDLTKRLPLDEDRESLPAAVTGEKTEKPWEVDGGDVAAVESTKGDDAGSSSSKTNVEGEAYVREASTKEIGKGGIAVQGSAECPAIWDLRPYNLGQSHIMRVVQILTEWTRRNALQVVAVSSFSSSLPAQLQLTFVQCFHGQLAPQPSGTSSKKKGSNAMRAQNVVSKALSVKSATIDEAGGNLLPTLMLEDVPLPVESLPSERFSLRELLKRHILWLAVHFVANLDLGPGPPIPGGGRSPTIGADPVRVEELARALAGSQVLTSLSLRSSELGEQGGLVLADSLERCPRLRWLDIGDNGLGPKAAAKVMQAVEQGATVTVLDLSRNGIGCEGARAMAEPLSNCSCLCDLRLAQNGIDDEGAEALAECLLTNTSLTDFSLIHNNIGLAGAAGLLRATGSSHTLQKLSLDHNTQWPTYEGSETLVNTFVDMLGRERAPSMQSCLISLSLRHCGIRSMSAVRLFSALALNGTLRTLSLAWNGIRQVGTAEIASLLASPGSALEELDLRDNPLGAQDTFPSALHHNFGHVARKRDRMAGERPMTPREHGGEGSSGQRLRATNARLRVLHLGNTETTANGAAMLAEALPAFEGLEELYLYHNPEVGDGGAQVLAKLLSSEAAMRSLSRLSLAVCAIGDAGCRSLSSALLSNELLTELDLSCNTIGQAGSSALADVLLRNRTLESLNVAMNAIAPTGLRELVRAVAQNSQSAIREVDVSAQGAPATKSMLDETARATQQSEGADPAEPGWGNKPDVLSKFTGLD